MATINNKNGKLQLDFRYKGKRCREQTKRKKSLLNPATINKIMTPLRMMLNEAADRYEFTSPFLGIKSLKTPRIDVEPFSIEEVQLILKTVRKDFLPYYTTRFFTGMRTDEIDGLQWPWYLVINNRSIFPEHLLPP